MNILIYFGDQLCPTAGGTERVACMLADYFISKAHNVYYLACRHVDLPNAVESEFLPDEREAPTPANIRAVNEIIKKHNIDIILNEGGFGEVSRLFSHEHIPSNIKIISHLHFDPLRKGFYQSLYLPISFNVQGLRNLISWMKSPYWKWKFNKHIKKRFEYIVDNSDSVVVLCEGHKRIMERMTDSNQKNKIHSITNPLTFSSPDVEINEKRNEIIFVGRLEYTQKRVDRILKAWKCISEKYPDWCLKIIGDGEDRARLELMADKKNLKRIEFTGRTNPKSYYEKSKILLLTSNHEGTPMVIQEAMSYGVVPVVMNSFSAASDMIDSDYNGLLIKPFKIKDLINTVDRVISDGEYFESLSSNARMTIANIDNNQVFKQWERLINQDSKR